MTFDETPEVDFWMNPTWETVPCGKAGAIDQNFPVEHILTMENEKSFKNWFMQHITLHSFDNPREELANGLTHLFGALLSLVALFAIILKSGPKGNDLMTFGGIIFGLTMFLLYTSSSAYHLTKGPVLKRVMRVLDHANIYFLIAGTYTPVMLYIQTQEAMLILAIVWIMTLVGILFTLVFWGRLGFLHVLFYIGMGWLVVLVWSDLVRYISTEFLYWAVAGGLTYTGGTIFYGMKKLPFYHAIWHMFVVGGSLCFFVGIYIHLL